MPDLFLTALPLLPASLMLAAALACRAAPLPVAARWRWLQCCAWTALAAALLGVLVLPAAALAPWLRATPIGLLVALLVQLLGAVIGAFSARYLKGEAGQARYMAALAAVLASVQLLLLADHWLLLGVAWCLAGLALQPLLCFYHERPFAQLAAHKKRLADRGADLLLACAAALAWRESGSGVLSDLWAHLAREGMSPAMQVAAVCLVLAVVLRSALLPVHGWLIQVMEAPTPVSALLHAGVVNLGGFVLIRCAPLLEQAAPARALLFVFGLATAVLAGMVMLTRVSVKVRLAWSTVAQMGFMALECALGLYTLAALHLLGHSLYKAHAFLSASSAVQASRLRALQTPAVPHPASLLAAPVVTAGAVLLVAGSDAPWPWWWSVLLGLAWAPLAWLPRGAAWPGIGRALAGVLIAAMLTQAALLAHALPLGLHDMPHDLLGIAALAGGAVLYLLLALIQWRPASLEAWRRWSYAGFYIDEIYTRLALRHWPSGWALPARSTRPGRAPAAAR